MEKEVNSLNTKIPNISQYQNQADGNIGASQALHLHLKKKEFNFTL
jgi:hypothetical protein